MVIQRKDFFSFHGFQRGITTHVKMYYRKMIMNRHKMPVTSAMRTLPIIVTGLLLSLSPRSQAIWSEYFSFIIIWKTSSPRRRSCFTWTEVMEVLGACLPVNG